MRRFCFVIAMICTLSGASNLYPLKPITFIVGLSKGGSADQMARNMAIFLEKELNVPINVIDKSGNASLDAANYVLSQPPNGYTIFISSFSPYLISAIINKEAEFTLDDFQFINLQWFDEDIFLVRKNSKIKSIKALIYQTKKHLKSIKVATVNQSSGNLIMKLLLKTLNIPFHNVLFKLFKSEKLARDALIKSKANLLIISTHGSEQYRNEIKPLAIVSDEKSKRWDAPTLNQALSKSYIRLPMIDGPITGFAVSKKFKEKYPKRYLILENAIKRVLAEVKVQKILKKKHIGSIWLGSRQSTKILNDEYKFLKNYDYLLK